jgi:hypothetical protein
MRENKGNLVGAYVPTAIYYQEADFLEYVREDVPCVNRRIDEFLTLVLDMHDRRPIGIKIKGFRYFYNTSVKKGRSPDKNEFVSLAEIFEQLMKVIGDDIFDQLERRRAYEQAIEIAQTDQVRISTDQIAA